MDEDMSPSFPSLSHDWLRLVGWRCICWLATRLRAHKAEEYHSSREIVMRLLFSLREQVKRLTRWGLFLMRGVHTFFGSIAYSKANAFHTLRNRAQTLDLFRERPSSVSLKVRCVRSSFKRAGLEQVQMMITK
jgi:hypothetical protein